MRLFLIDYENVNSSGMRGIGQVAPDDRVILFYSQAANTLSFEIMDEMMSANIVPERICLSHSGKNALDFQLVTFLGYLVAQKKADEYFIISCDAGYQSAITFCREYLGANVQMKSTVRAALARSSAARRPVQTAAAGRTARPAAVRLRKKVVQVQPAAPAAQRYQDTAPTLDTILALIEPPVTVGTAEEILACLRRCRSKTEFHNALQQRFDNDTCKQFYHCLKPCFADFLED
ncbi:MAG: hypothetical protein IK107_05530 [Oscillospiraceae bacterium]|nr:hypothetical protein [Oscillospiraceae bacterium]